MRRILFTRLDGGVSLCQPTDECLTHLRQGGYWGMLSRGRLEAEIERGIAAGFPERAQRRFVHAMAFGGLTEAEAWGVIRDRDCAAGTAHELVDVADLPDRWFRDAWRRSHNGGPIVIDLEAARDIQWRRIRQAAADMREQRRADWRRASEELDIDMGRLARGVSRARDTDQLRAVWPAGDH